MSSASEDVYCTLLMSDSYLPGAAVLAKSLRDSGTKRKLAVLVTGDSLLYSTITALNDLFDYVLPVDRIANPNLENLARLDRLDLRFAFTKIALWRQTQFRKIVYLDADVLALRAPDELFDIDSHFAAAPDIGWPDIFNSGVMMLVPSVSEYWSLHTLASSGTSFDGADQGLLNEYFGNRPWHRLSFAYNCTPSASYQYEPAYRHFRSSISMVHFIGKDKPWTKGREALSQGSGGVYRELLGKWWSVYDRHYRTAPSSALDPPAPGTRAVQQYVKDEQPQSSSEWATTGQLPGYQPPPPTPSSSTGPSSPPEAPTVSTEPPLTESVTTAKGHERSLVEPAPTAQQRKFSAPSMEWDATRSAPPTTTKPEAQNFPSQHYDMSSDHGLFRAPEYKAVPKDMYYSVPEQKDPPKAIFPWESKAPKPTRVFAEDEPVASSEPETAATPTLPPTDTPAIPIAPSENASPWKVFSRGNAWDEDASIDRYVRNFKQLQSAQRRGKIQVLYQDQEPGAAEKDFATTPESPAVPRRRESMILTDFPDADDRPSLPVTPAPIHRQSFWGTDKEQGGVLPPAEGVPEQAEWNPTESLEQLRRSSLIATEDLPKATTLQQEIPRRGIPRSSISGRSDPAFSFSGSSTLPTTAEVNEGPPDIDQIKTESTSSSASAQSSNETTATSAVPSTGEGGTGPSLFRETDLSGQRQAPPRLRTDTVGPLDEYSIA